MQKPSLWYTLQFKLKTIEPSITYYNTIHAAKDLDACAENIRRGKSQLGDGTPGKRMPHTTNFNYYTIFKKLLSSLYNVQLLSHLPN
jgi:hypothetical protein